MPKLLREYGEIKNEAKCISELRRYIPDLKRLQDVDVVNKVNESVRKTNKCRYFTHKYIELEESEGCKDVMWVDTGYMDIIGRIVYIQYSGGEGSWTGAFVGTEESILNHQEERKRQREGVSRDTLSAELGVDINAIEGVTVSLASEEKRVEPAGQSQKSSSSDEDIFLNNLYSKLLIPSSWDVMSLKSYINTCISRLNSLLASGEDCSNYIIVNKGKTCIIFNSGLLDKFGKYILIQTKAYSKLGHEGGLELMYTGLFISGGKAYLTGLGFERDDLNKTLERVQFSDNGISDLIFTGEIEDFDLESRNRLEHCITERRSRFPESYATASDEMICSDIIRAIEIAVELNKYDRNYIKPTYNKERDKINFIVPYHIANDFQKKPELGIVIDKICGYWQIMTILTYEDVMKDIKLFNMYENETF